MRRTPIFVAGLALAAVPAAWGLVGNPSFSHTVPVQVPPQVQVADTASPPPAAPGAGGEDRPGPTSAAHDRARGTSDDRSPAGISGGAGTSGRHPEAGDDRGRHPEPGDDRGQAVETGQGPGRHVEPGDDRGAAVEPGDDRSGRTSTNSGRSATSGPAVASGHGSGSGSGSSGSGSDDGPNHR